MRAENGAIREQLRKLEEQQTRILHLMDELQRKLDGRPPTSHTNRLLHPSLNPRQQPRRQRSRNPPLRQNNLPQIETLPRRIPTKTVLFW